MLRRALPIILAATLLLSACTSAPQQSNASPSTEESINPKGQLIVYSGRSEPLIQPVITAFNEKYPEVEVLLKSGNNSQLANTILEEKSNPQADVFVTVDAFTMFALNREGVFMPYKPVGYENLPDSFKDPDGAWVGLTERLRIIMYNKDLVSPEELPTSVFDLTDPKWKGQIASAGSTNASMQAQIAAMIELVGRDKTKEWLQGLIDNDVTFFGGHTDVRKSVGAGEFKLGLANHYYYYLQLAEGSNLGIIYPDQGEGEMGVVSNATAAGILNGTKNPAAAKAFLDFLVSPEGQKIFADGNYEYPLLKGVALHADIDPLNSVRMAQVTLAQVVNRFDDTFDLMEEVNLP